MPPAKKPAKPKKSTAQRKRSTPRKHSTTANASQASAASVREALARGIVLTRERIDQTLDDAVRRGRITRADAEELGASLVGLGRRGAQDLLADVEQLVGRGRRRTSEGTDTIVRHVDRARRVAGIGPTFPILGYDELTAAQVVERASDLSQPELRKVRDYERRNANRKSVLTAIERALR